MRKNYNVTNVNSRRLATNSNGTSSAVWRERTANTKKWREIWNRIAPWSPRPINRNHIENKIKVSSPMNVSATRGGHLTRANWKTFSCGQLVSASHSNIEIYFFPRFKEKEVNISSHWSDHLPTKNDKITGVRLLPILWPDSSGWNFPLIFFRISSIFSFLFLKIFRRLFVAQFHIENFSFYEIKCVRRCTRIDQKRGRRLIHSRRVDDGYFWKQIGRFHQFVLKFSVHLFV